MSRPACGRPIPKGKGRWSDRGDECIRPRMKGKQRCEWHWLLVQPMHVQQAWANRRLLGAPDPHRPRVPNTEWPEGERWCSGCQSMVPLFYAMGSRCRSCASTAAHSQRIEKLYGITGEEYDRLLIFQAGRCYICRRLPQSLRLAVDHDHKTGEVRGLLCANNENGCNRGVVANLEAAADGGLAAARRAVAYFEHPPYARMTGRASLSATLAAKKASGGPSPQPPPF